MSRWAWIAVLALAPPAFGDGLLVPRIAPGSSVANAFDGDPETMFCAPVRAQILYYVSARDRNVLEHLTAIRFSASDAGAREVAVHVYYSSVPEDQPDLHVTLDRGDARIAIPPTRHAHGPQLIEIEVTPAKPTRAPMCIGEIEWLGPSGPLQLPDLGAALAVFRARDHALASVHAVSKEYVTAFEWTYRPRDSFSVEEGKAYYAFRADGTFSRTGPEDDDDEDDGPSRRHSPKHTGTWTLDGATLKFDGLRLRLGPCEGHPGYFCNDHLVPTSAE